MLELIRPKMPHRSQRQVEQEGITNSNFSRVTRVIRVIRLIRLIRIVKLYKQARIAG
jgi:hypothetical protein